MTPAERFEAGIVTVFVVDVEPSLLVPYQDETSQPELGDAVKVTISPA